MPRPLAIACLAALAACGGNEPAAVVVGPVAFTESQLLGLTPTRRRTLARITALGLAVADSTTGALGEPLLERWRDDALLESLSAALTLEENGVGDEVLEARYLTDPAYELTVRHILFFSERWRTEPERAAARAKAERALTSIRAGADFAETAATLSEEPGAEGRQGLLTPGRQGAWVDEFWNAASALQPGEISPVTETQYGFHILRLENRTVVPFAEARDRVARQVARQIGDPRAVLDAWLDERASTISVDGGAADAVASGGAEPSRVLATAPGIDALTAGAFERWAATEPAPWPARPGGGDAEAVKTAATRLATRRIGLAEAARLGLGLSDAQREAVARRWDDLTYRWAASLGFSGGMSTEGVAEAALRALGNPAQGISIVRDEVDGYAPLIERGADIRVGPPEG